MTRAGRSVASALHATIESHHKPRTCVDVAVRGTDDVDTLVYHAHDRVARYDSVGGADARGRSWVGRIRDGWIRGWIGLRLGWLLL